MTIMNQIHPYINGLTFLLAIGVVFALIALMVTVFKMLQALAVTLAPLEHTAETLDSMMEKTNDILLTTDKVTMSFSKIYGKFATYLPIVHFVRKHRRHL